MLIAHDSSMYENLAIFLRKAVRIGGPKRQTFFIMKLFARQNFRTD